MTAAEKERALTEFMRRDAAGEKIDPALLKAFIEAQNEEATAGIAIGQTAPGFELKDQNGRTHTLKSLMGVVTPRAGTVITGAEADFGPDVVVFHAGTRRRDDGVLVAAGGRVLNVVGSGADVAAARAAAYELAGTVSFRGGWYRRDIAARL